MLRPSKASVPKSLLGGEHHEISISKNRHPALGSILAFRLDVPAIGTNYAAALRFVAARSSDL